jgi:hypothetical protein
VRGKAARSFQAPENEGLADCEKALEVDAVVCYPVFAFVALVSPLGCKAVARSNLRPFFVLYACFAGV